MKRVERLFQLMLLMQGGNVLTSQQLSRKLGVSVRTVYRDIGDLVKSGVQIDGESGVGFLLRDENRLPPLSFTNDELKALALGAEMVRAWSDRDLGNASDTAIRKIAKAFRIDRIVSIEGTAEPFEHTARCKVGAYAVCQLRDRSLLRRGEPDKLTPPDKTATPTSFEHY
jgi:predicted DNA-binding transcriptional regulator YafY